MTDPRFVILAVAALGALLILYAAGWVWMTSDPRRSALHGRRSASFAVVAGHVLLIGAVVAAWTVGGR